MCGFSRGKESLFYILCGAGFALPPALLLLFIYGMCLTNPARPDYYSAKIRMLFSFPDPGVLTWLAISGVLFGISIAIVGVLRPFLRKREDR